VGAAEALGGACDDCLSRANGIFTHVAVPHAKHAPPLIFKPFVTDNVVLRFSVLAAVDLDHQLGLAEAKSTM
jgi:hypothetical protein